MSVTDIPDCRYPFLDHELALIRQFIAQDRPMLGICLGAQLLAHAAGAKVYPNTRPGRTPQEAPAPVIEVGWRPVVFPFPGSTEPIAYGLHDGAMMFHWHYDTFDLPRFAPPNTPTAPGGPLAASGDSILLSSTSDCRNQAFRLRTRLFGFQYHFELTPEGIEAMLANDRATLERTLGHGGADRVRQDTQRYYPAYERLGNRLIGNAIDFMKLA